MVECARDCAEFQYVFKVQICRDCCVVSSMAKMTFHMEMKSGPSMRFVSVYKERNMQGEFNVQHVSMLALHSMYMFYI